MDFQRALPKYDQGQVEALHNYMTELSPRELKAIFLRFWGPCSIEEIARDLQVSWDMADQILNRALERLRLSCVRDSAFGPLEKQTFAA
jgi:RNA polymerase sigma factor (sigma-70 family)